MSITIQLKVESPTALFDAIAHIGQEPSAQAIGQRVMSLLMTGKEGPWEVLGLALAYGIQARVVEMEQKHEPL